jgi:hypothetical protein
VNAEIAMNFSFSSKIPFQYKISIKVETLHFTPSGPSFRNDSIKGQVRCIQTLTAQVEAPSLET